MFPTVNWMVNDLTWLACYNSYSTHKKKYWASSNDKHQTSEMYQKF